MAKKDDASQKKNITCEEILIVHQSKPDAKGRFHKIRVVKWTIDGVKHPPKLEKRGFYKDAKGATLHGDHETFNRADWDACTRKATEIEVALLEPVI